MSRVTATAYGPRLASRVSNVVQSIIHISLCLFEVAECGILLHYLVGEAG